MIKSFDGVVFCEDHTDEFLDGCDSCEQEYTLRVGSLENANEELKTRYDVILRLTGSPMPQELIVDAKVDALLSMVLRTNKAKMTFEGLLADNMRAIVENAYEEYHANHNAFIVP